MVATAIKNANVAVIFSFLHRIIEVREREREREHLLCVFSSTCTWLYFI